MINLKNKNHLILTQLTLAPFIESLKKMIKFSPQPEGEELVNSTQLGTELTAQDLSKLELLLFLSFVMAVQGSEENTTFAKKFYPERLSLLVSLILGTLTCKYFSNDFKYDALKFFHANFDFNEASHNEVFSELDADAVNDSTPYYIPFSFSFERNENFRNYFYKSENENPEAMGFGKKEFFTPPQEESSSSEQDFVKAPQPSALNFYEITNMKPRFDNESDKEFEHRARIHYYKAALKCHPDKNRESKEAEKKAEEEFKKLSSAYDDFLIINKVARSAEPETTTNQNYPSRSSRGRG